MQTEREEEAGGEAVRLYYLDIFFFLIVGKAIRYTFAERKERANECPPKH